MAAIRWVDVGRATPFIEQQIALLRQATERSSSEPAAWRRLIALLREAGRESEAIDLQRAQLERAPSDCQGWLDLGRLLMASGRFDEAQAAFARVCTPELRATALARRGAALARLHRFEAAERAFRAALALDPDEPFALRGLGSSLIRAGDGSALEDHCRDCMTRLGAVAWLLSHLAVALAFQGRSDALQELLDYDRLLDVVDIQPPAEYGGLAAFNGVLAEALEEHAPLRPISTAWDTPVRSALLARFGWRDASDAPAEAASAFVRLEQIFKDEVQRYRDDDRMPPDHPHTLQQPQVLSLEAGAHVLRTGGHIAPHAHPLAWVNAVYYVEMPGEVTESATGAGWLHFGPPAYEDERLARCWPRRRVQPRPGRLVLFPSFWSHYVAPVEVERNRTTIAFEVTPVELAAHRDGQE
jgi:tetratricopeptide (TPR) repeat protein